MVFNSQIVFLNGPSSASFSFCYRLFKQPLQFLQQIYVKKSIQYTPLGFKPLEHESPPLTTRAVLPPNSIIIRQRDVW